MAGRGNRYSNSVSSFFAIHAGSDDTHPGSVSLRRKVPASVPSLHHSSTPPAGSARRRSAHRPAPRRVASRRPRRPRPPSPAPGLGRGRFSGTPPTVPGGGARGAGAGKAGGAAGAGGRGGGAVRAVGSPRERGGRTTALGYPHAGLTPRVAAPATARRIRRTPRAPRPTFRSSSTACAAGRRARRSS